MRITSTLVMGAALAVALPATVHAQQAETTLRNADGDHVGTVSISESPHGILVDARFQGLPSGVHAFHIHETGQCEPFSAAGGHLNPHGTAHGFMDPDGYHAGDMPNIHVGGGRSLRVSVFVPGITLHHLFDHDGSAIVIHAGADDYSTDPAGAAGDRIACGVIR